LASLLYFSLALEEGFELPFISSTTLALISSSPLAFSTSFSTPTS